MQAGEFTFKIVPHPKIKNEAGAMYVEMLYEGIYRNIVQKDGSVNSYVPIFNLYFYAKSHNESEQMAKIVFDAYMNGYQQEEGFWAFIRHLKVLGFEPTNGILDWNKLRKRQLKNSIIFKPTRANIKIPEDFGGEKVEKRKISQKLEIAY
jgi:hypothetical protein